MRRRIPLLLGTLCFTASAQASPAVPRVLIAPYVTRIAVGQTVRFRGLQPGGSALDAPIEWKVEGAAGISKDGLLTAAASGNVVVTAKALGMPSYWESGEMRFVVAQQVPGGRLPRLEGGPKEEDILGFGFEWPQTGSKDLPHSGPTLSLTTPAGYLLVSTGAVPDAALPWTLAFVPEHSFFRTETWVCIVTPEQVERARTNLTKASVTISEWKDGVATGRLAFETSVGVAFDASFAAALPDRDGILAKAAAPKEANPK